MNELIEFRAACVADMKAIADASAEHGRTALTEDEQSRWDQLEAWVGEADVLIERAARVQALEDAAPTLRPEGSPTLRTAPAVVAPKTDSPTQVHPLEVLHDRFNYSPEEHARRVRDAAMQLIDDNCYEPEHKEAASAKLRGQGVGVQTEGVSGAAMAAEHYVKFGNEDYVRAFQKLASGSLTPLDADELRAVHIATGHGSGGEVVVPTHLDPSVVINNAGSQSDIRRMADNITLTEGNVWNGVSSAGVTLEWLGEGAEAADASPTFVGKSISVHKSAAYVEGSIEAFQDIAGLGSTLVQMLADGREQQLNPIFINGSGTAQPWGIETRLDATVASEVATDAVGVFDADDLYDLRYVELPVRWRERASFLMSDGIEATVRQFGSSDANFSVNILANGLRTLMGRPLGNTEVLDTAVATGNNIIIFGDFSHYKIVERMGSTVERIQHVMGANQRPVGKRGIVMYSRVGADTHITEPFRLLQVA